MTRLHSKILLLAASLCGLIWFVEALIDTYVFSAGTFWNQLVFDVPAHEVYMRGLTFLCIAVFAGIFVATAHRLQLAKTSLRTKETDLRTTLQSIGDAVISTDIQGRIQRMNAIAEALTGWSVNEAKDRALGEVFHIVHAQTRQVSQDPVQKVLRTGTVQGLANHTVLISKQGAEYHIADSASPIRDDQDQITGVVLIFRDVSEEYTARRLTQMRLSFVEHAATHSLDEFLTKVLDDIGEVVHSPIGFYHFVHADQQTLTLQQWSTRTKNEFCRISGQGAHYPIDRAGVWMDCVREKRPIIHNDYQALPHKKGLPQGHAPVIRELTIPVMRGDNVVAVLGVGNKPSDYTDKDLEAATFLADVSWGIVQRKLAEEKAIHLNRILRAIRNVNQLITVEKDPARLTQKACDCLIETRGYTNVWIGLFDANGKLYAAAQAGLDQAFEHLARRLETGELPFCVQTALQQADIVVIGDTASTCSDCPLAKSYSERGAMAIRLDHAGKAYGILAASSSVRYGQDEEERDLFREVAGDLAFALHNIGLEQEHSHTVEALRENEKKFRNIFNSSNDAIFIHDMDGRFLEVNAAACQSLGYTRDELLHMTLMDLDPPQSSPSASERIRRAAESGFAMFEVIHKRKDGREFPVEINSRTIDYLGHPCLLKVARNITERKAAEQALVHSRKNLRQERDYLDNIFQNSADAIAIVDKDGRFTRWNKRAAEIFGYSFQDMQGKHYSEFYARREELENMLTELRADGSVHEREVTVKNKDGTTRPCSISISLLKDEANFSIGSISIVRDLTEWKKAQDKLEEMSLYDSLTRLYNRSFFEEEMRRLGVARYCPMGIIVCDINGLKLINDSMGHEKGDELLKASGEILKKCFRTSDIVARIGGDEFAVLLPQSDEEVLKRCCARIREQVAEYQNQDPHLGLSISIGYALEHTPPVDMNRLFKRADDAMYKEKLQQSYSSRSETVQALIKTLEARDFITEGHAGRLHDYTLQLGKSLGLAEDKLNDLQLLARFHDLGKVGIPDRILFKPGPLTEDEFQEMKSHCEIGHRIALALYDLAPIADYILKHHEWWNGKGYPLGLAGLEIPLECRILGIVDAYDAMTSERPYKAAMAHQSAVDELRRCAGTQFDPDLVELFIHSLEHVGETLHA